MFKNIKFGKLNNLKLKNENIKVILFDLGYSYTQIKDQKGYHLIQLVSLMGLNNFSANEVVNNLNNQELEKILNILEMKMMQKNFSKYCDGKKKRN